MIGSYLKDVLTIPHFTFSTFEFFPPILKLLIYPIIILVYFIYIPIRFLLYLVLPKKKKSIYESMPKELKWLWK